MLGYNRVHTRSFGKTLRPEASTLKGQANVCPAAQHSSLLVLSLVTDDKTITSASSREMCRRITNVG